MSLSWLLFFFTVKVYRPLFPSHTSFITLSSQGEVRDSYQSISKEEFFNSISREGKRKVRDVALVYPWLPWLYCCLSWAADAINVLGEK